MKLNALLNEAKKETDESGEGSNDIGSLIRWAFENSNSHMIPILLSAVKKGHTVSFEEIDQSRNMWDNAVYIKFKSATVADVINTYVSPSKADEVSMKGTVLRLWWD
jgi:hypothetical protein